MAFSSFYIWAAAPPFYFIFFISCQSWFQIESFSSNIFLYLQFDSSPIIMFWTFLMWMCLLLHFSFGLHASWISRLVYTISFQAIILLWWRWSGWWFAGGITLISQPIQSSHSPLVTDITVIPLEYHQPEGEEKCRVELNWKKLSEW